MQPGELEAAQEHFECIPTRMAVESGDLVVSRYSCLPFYKEQEFDITYVGAKLINTLRQHWYVADLQNWYYDLEGLTPKTWFRMEDVPKDGGPFVLKGKTNSKKHDWKTHMFAADWDAAQAVHWRLCQDGLIGSQDVYIRQFVPLVRFTTGLNELPITKEFRIFVCDGQILSGAYYWTGYSEEMGFTPSFDEVPREFLDEVLRRIGNKIRFYVVDVAQTAAGDWVVIELNDGQMSGLSDNDPQVLYRELRRVLDNEQK